MVLGTVKYRFGTFMRRCTLTIWFLLGYFALLVNLGPSLHHADLFGLHSHASDNTNADMENDAAVSCCCCQHHSAAQNEGPSETTGSAGFDVDTACHDCAFCEFFKHFNAFDHSFEFEERETHAQAVSFDNDSSVDDEPIASTARGPPSITISIAI
jgi:hypothetical protein